MTSLTPVLTLACIGTVGGIVAVNEIAEHNDPGYGAVAYVGQNGQRATHEEPAGSARLPLAKPLVLVADDDVTPTDVTLARIRWQERLDDARREMRREETQPPAPSHAFLEPSQREMQRRARLQQQRQIAAQRRQRAAELRSRRAKETIYTQSSGYKRYGSSYPKTQLNRRLRRMSR